MGDPALGGDCLNLRQVLLHALFLHGLWPDTIFGISGAVLGPHPDLPVLPGAPGAGPPLGAVRAPAGHLRRRGNHPSRSGVVPGPHPLLVRLLEFHGADFALGMGLAYWQLGPRRTRHGRLSPAWLVATSMAILVVGVGLRYGSARAGVPAIGRGAGGQRPYHRGGAGGRAPGRAPLRRSGGLLGRALACRRLAWLGSLSYSIYLTHMLAVAGGLIVYRLMAPRPSLLLDAAFLAAFTASVVAGGWIFHVLVRMPPRAGGVVVPRWSSCRQIFWGTCRLLVAVDGPGGRDRHGLGLDRPPPEGGDSLGSPHRVRMNIPVRAGRIPGSPRELRAGTWWYPRRLAADEVSPHPTRGPVAVTPDRAPPAKLRTLGWFSFDVRMGRSAGSSLEDPHQAPGLCRPCRGAAPPSGSRRPRSLLPWSCRIVVPSVSSPRTGRDAPACPGACAPGPRSGCHPRRRAGRRTRRCGDRRSRRRGRSCP